MEMIISALVFAMKKIGSKVTDSVIDDVISVGLEKLKSKLSSKGGPEVESAVEKLGEDPSRKTVQSHLGLVLEETGLQDDEEILGAARSLLESDSEGQEILRTIEQHQQVGEGGKAAQIAGNDNTVNIG